MPLAAAGQAAARAAGARDRAARLGQDHARSMCASSPRPTAICEARQRRRASAPISTTASTCSRSTCRRCASASTTCPTSARRLIEDISASGDFLNAADHAERIVGARGLRLARQRPRAPQHSGARALILSDSGRLTGDDFVHILPVSAEAGPGPAPQMTARSSPMPKPRRSSRSRRSSMRSPPATARSAGSRADAAHLARDVLQEARQVRTGVGIAACLTFETARVRKSLQFLTPSYRHSPVAFARDPPQFQAFPRKAPDLAQGLL